VKRLKCLLQVNHVIQSEQNTQYQQVKRLKCLLQVKHVIQSEQNTQYQQAVSASETLEMPATSETRHSI
jgi:hypothetical protein